MLELAVTDKCAGIAAVRKAQQHFGAIDVLINNAGYGYMGVIEELNEQEIRQQIETNVFGLLWITQAVLPIIRAQKLGHIIQVSSALELVTLPLMGLCSAPKFAVEAIGESLAGEVSGFSIEVTILEPSGFSTDFNSSSLNQSTPLQEYDQVRTAMFASQNADDTGVS